MEVLVKYWLNITKYILVKYQFHYVSISQVSVNYYQLNIGRQGLIKYRLILTDILPILVLVFTD